MYVKKCPSSIRCRDSNSRPLEHEPPPITTRPGLPPYSLTLDYLRAWARLRASPPSKSKLDFRLYSALSPFDDGVVVVAQLVEPSLPIPEVRGSNPVIGKNLYLHWTFVSVNWKDENKEKEAGCGPFKKKFIWSMYTHCYITPELVPSWFFIQQSIWRQWVLIT